ncbi:MAG: 50S ribosomal protein L11 methyltransferase [Turneriella sp.]|nr:50S ribosomal protein L11 methyltransferase [Turneriella sp.]
MNYIQTVFWQIEIAAPKNEAHTIEEFFLKAGAQSTFELLYAEGQTNNLVEDNTNLYFFFSEDFPAKAFIPMALATLGLPDLPFKVSQVKYADYLKEFEKTFKAFALTSKTALVPPWDKENPEISPQLKKLFLVPGMAFGTGKHATTQLMVEFLEETVTPADTVIDMGSGSGILAIAALLYGAKEAYGYDVETLAAESAATNLEINRLEYQKEFKAHFAVGDFSSLSGISHDPRNTVFVANILPNIFEANSVPLKAALQNCRAWALSGIPVAQDDTFGPFLKSLTGKDFAKREKDEWLIYYAAPG